MIILIGTQITHEGFGMLNGIHFMSSLFLVQEAMDKSFCIPTRLWSRVSKMKSKKTWIHSEKFLLMPLMIQSIIANGVELIHGAIVLLRGMEKFKFFRFLAKKSTE